MVKCIKFTLSSFFNMNYYKILSLLVFSLIVFTPQTQAALTMGATTLTSDGVLTVTASSTDFSGNISLPATTSTLGQINMGGSLFIHAYGVGNTFLGVGAGNLTMTGDSNVYIGTSSGLLNTSGYNNTMIGKNSFQANTSGYKNTGLGKDVLYSNTTGHRNTAVGESALYGNTTGYRNNAVGIAALFTNTTGYQNTADGQAALYLNTTGYSNTAQGQSALYNNTTGYQNSGFGQTALTNNTTGNQNTAIGVGSGIINTTGNQNTFLGASAGAAGSTDGLINATAIGYNTQVTASNALILGNGASVGIGTTAPNQKLEVNGGIMINTVTAKPTCNVTARGTFWVTQGAGGVKDAVEVCAKDAGDAYAWRTIY